jgi:hypothetical protein
LSPILTQNIDTGEDFYLWYEDGSSPSLTYVVTKESGSVFSLYVPRTGKSMWDLASYIRELELRIKTLEDAQIIQQGGTE